MTEVEALTALVGTGGTRASSRRPRSSPTLTWSRSWRPPPPPAGRDQVQDPQNLGALIRTAAAVDAGRSSSRATGDGRHARRRNGRRRWCGIGRYLPGDQYGASARTPQARRRLERRPDAVRRDGPVSVRPAGAAGAGRRRRGRDAAAGGRHCDLAVSIRMWGAVESLNVSVAAAVALYEVRRRWDV